MAFHKPGNVNSVSPFTLIATLSCALLAGCGTTKSNVATEQLLTSDAVDVAVGRIDFTPLAGQSVYFDTKFIKDYKGVGFVNSDYVISSLRQQMVAAGLRLQEKETEADFVIEGRIGTLGADAHEVVYGIPSNNGLTAAASAVAAVAAPGAQTISVPEIAVARRNDQVAAAKIGVFAYERESREAVWQSGLSVARSNAKDSWFLGAGPFQRGTIYNGRTRFAGEAIGIPLIGTRKGHSGNIAGYREEAIFKRLDDPGTATLAETPSEGSDDIQQASGEASKEGTQTTQSAEHTVPK